MPELEKREEHFFSSFAHYFRESIEYLPSEEVEKNYLIPLIKKVEKTCKRYERLIARF
jgi:hypothetical protein